MIHSKAKGLGSSGIRGQKTASLRVSKALALVVGEMAQKRGVTASDMIETAFRGNAGLAREFERTMHPWAGLVELAKLSRNGGETC